MIKEINDYEVVYLAQENNEDARELLNQKYKPLITKVSQKYYKLLKEKGLEIEDIILESTLAFNEAISNYNEKKDSIFYTFAISCIKNKLISIVRKENTEKSKILNESISLDKVIDETEGNTLLNFIKDDNGIPEKIIIAEEDYQIVYQKIINHLSNLEECVLILKMQNFNYKEIASILDKDEKSIDNAVQRIKYKFKNIKNNTSI